MSFPFNAYALALLSSFLLSAASLPLWRRWCLRTGHVDDPGHRKIHHEPIPLAGGLAVATGFLLPIAGATLVLIITSRFGDGSGVGLQAGTTLFQSFAHGLGARSLQLAAIIAGASGMVVLGWLDDRHELKAGPKFAGQCLIALLVAASGVRITLFVPSLLFSYFVTVLWMLTLINAFNFMDNMNGLCAGLSALASFFFALSAAVHGQYLVASLALLGAGSMLGFLPYNFPRACAFLGDAGSHLAGYLMAVLAILPHFYSETHPNRLAVLSPLLILAVPLADMAWVVCLRTWMGKPFWVGDTNHLSHRLVRRGMSKAAAVLIIWLMAAVCGSLALLL